MAELFGEDVVEPLENLLRSDAIPAGGDMPNGLAMCHEAALLLSAMAAMRTQPHSILKAARSILAMDYQFEFGPEASGDRKGRREGLQPPERDYFGTQLATTLGNIWGTAGPAAARKVWVDVTIGAGGIALIGYQTPARETTFVYSTRYLLPNLHTGIVKFNDMTFDLPVRLDVSMETLCRLGELMRGNRRGAIRKEAIG